MICAFWDQTIHTIHIWTIELNTFTHKSENNNAHAMSDIYELILSELDISLEMLILFLAEESLIAIRWICIRGILSWTVSRNIDAHPCTCISMDWAFDYSIYNPFHSYSHAQTTSTYDCWFLPNKYWIHGGAMKMECWFISVFYPMSLCWTQKFRLSSSEKCI